MAPEQWWPDVKLTAAVDQFSLAVIIYRLITEELPFEHDGKESDEARLRNFERGPIPAHEAAEKHGRFKMPKAVSTVISKALDIKPEKRYKTVGDFVVALKKALIYKSPDKNDIFNSYRRKPSSILAQHIREKLNNTFKISALVDVLCVDGAGQLPDIIKQQIENCDVFVCLLENDTLESKWVNTEILIAF